LNRILRDRSNSLRTTTLENGSCREPENKKLWKCVNGIFLRQKAEDMVKKMEKGHFIKITFERGGGSRFQCSKTVTWDIGSPILLQDVFNGDETDLNFRALLEHIHMYYKSDRAKGSKTSKKRLLTILCCASMNGGKNINGGRWESQNTVCIIIVQL